MFTLQEIRDFVTGIYGPINPATGKPRSFTLVPYAFPTTFLALAQNGVATNPISINANADFVCLAIRHRAQIGAAQTLNTVTAPFIRALITDSGSGEQWTAAAVDLMTYTVSGQFSRPLEYPRWVAGRTALSVQVTNYAPTAETYTSVDVVLAGLLCRVTDA